MSRIGRKPVPVPDKVKVSTDGRTLKVEGPLGKLDALMPPGVTVKVENGEANVGAPAPARGNRGYQGLIRALLANMVYGVTKGYEKKLEIAGVGYKAELKGRVVHLNLGYTHPVSVELPDGVNAEVDKSQTKVSITGYDKQKVGQVAAKIRAYKPTEPYKGKGVKYADEIVRRKVGKAGAK